MSQQSKESEEGADGMSAARQAVMGAAELEVLPKLQPLRSRTCPRKWREPFEIF